MELSGTQGLLGQKQTRWWRILFALKHTYLNSFNICEIRMTIRPERSRFFQRESAHHYGHNVITMITWDRFEFSAWGFWDHTTKWESDCRLAWVPVYDSNSQIIFHFFLCPVPRWNRQVYFLFAPALRAQRSYAPGLGPTLVFFSLLMVPKITVYVLEIVEPTEDTDMNVRIPWQWTN